MAVSFPQMLRLAILQNENTQRGLSRLSYSNHDMSFLTALFGLNVCFMGFISHTTDKSKYVGDCDDDDILYMMRDIFAFSFMQTVVKYNGVRNVKCSAFETPIKILKIWVQRIIT